MPEIQARDKDEKEEQKETELGSDDSPSEDEDLCDLEKRCMAIEDPGE